MARPSWIVKAGKRNIISQGLSDFNLSNTSDNQKGWVYDFFGNGYVLLDEANIKLKRDWHKNSLSVDSKKKPALFSTAWIDHGPSDNLASYSYIVVPNSDEKYVDEVASKPPVEILSSEWNLHVAMDKRSGAIGYIFEDGEQDINIGHLIKKDGHGFAMITPSGKGLKLSVCDPDLNPKGDVTPADWKVKKMVLTLKGKWKLKSNMI